MDRLMKRKLDIPQFLLILNGPPTAGKTSIGKIFYEKYNNIFFSSRDYMKNMISGYQDNPKEFLFLSHKMQLSLIDVAVDNGLSIVMDQGFISPSGDQELGDFIANELKKISEKHNVNILKFNIEASFDCLRERFIDRVNKAKKENTKISLTSLDEFERRFHLYMKHKKQNKTFFSDKLSPEEIFEKILEIIKK